MCNDYYVYDYCTFTQRATNDQQKQLKHLRRKGIQGTRVVFSAFLLHLIKNSTQLPLSLSLSLSLALVDAFSHDQQDMRCEFERRKERNQRERAKGTKQIESK